MSTQIVYPGKSAVGHWSQLLTLGTGPPTKPVQTLPLPSPERSQSQPSRQLGVHTGLQNGSVPGTPSVHSSPAGQGGLHIGSPPHTPSTHSCPSGQRLKQLPQWRSFLCRFTHLSPQRVWPWGQAQTLSSPRLTQFLEQHWESLLHSLPKRLQSSSAKATPGKETSAAPRRAPPTNLSALPLERVLLRAPWQARLRSSLSSHPSGG